MYMCVCVCVCVCTIGFIICSIVHYKYDKGY